MTRYAAAAPIVYVREAWSEIVRSARQPEFIIPTIVLAPAFYGLFGVVLGGGDAASAQYLLATFGVFATMGPAIFGFGANVAAERESGVLELKRLSPMPAGAHIAAKLTATLAYGGLAVLLIYGLAHYAGVRLSEGQWARLALVHALAVAPFALIGLAIGYRMRQNGAIAVANIAFFALAVLGGLWMPIGVFPPLMQSAAWVLPSFHLGELALMALGEQRPGSVWLHLPPVALFSLAMALLAWSGQRRSAA